MDDTLYRGAKVIAVLFSLSTLGYVLDKERRSPERSWKALAKVGGAVLATAVALAM